MEIQQVKDRKHLLELEILKSIESFEKETGCTVKAIENYRPLMFTGPVPEWAQKEPFIVTVILESL